MGLSQSKKVTSGAVEVRMEEHLKLVNKQIGEKIDHALKLYRRKFTSNAATTTYRPTASGHV